jgi:hypothetical protein
VKLIHHDVCRNLFIDIDVCADGFGAVAYHVKGDFPDGIPKDLKITKDMVQPIMFLSKRCTPAETRYTATEMEIAALVWVVRRLRHMIEGAPNTTVVFTDHLATPSIAQQTKLTTSNIDKLNTRLIWAS